MNKPIRYMALTDIVQPDGKRWTEVDDVESLIRLLLYSNQLDIKGIINCTSVYKKKLHDNEMILIHDLISKYGMVKKNLDRHGDNYPTEEYLHSVVKQGIPAYGKQKGWGFASRRYCRNEGVLQIIREVDAQDARPLWIGLWGGANTLAQAIWQVDQQRSQEELIEFLSKLRIYGISDQDASSRWIRENYGQYLFYIVSPSIGTTIHSNTQCFRRATWTGISCDHELQSDEPGFYQRVFQGARDDLVTKDWLTKHIVQGTLGECYPLPSYSMEGDTPSYLGLIPNGLNVPEHPEYGGWGGRYEKKIPPKLPEMNAEKYPIWTDTQDHVVGCDGQEHCSAQASIWRWRQAYQNDFAARMAWTLDDPTKEYVQAPVIIASKQNQLTMQTTQSLHISAKDSYDIDGRVLDYHWYVYQEAGTYQGKVMLDGDMTDTVTVTISKDEPQLQQSDSIHIILEVTNQGELPLTSYKRFIITG